MLCINSIYTDLSLKSERCLLNDVQASVYFYLFFLLNFLIAYYICLLYVMYINVWNINFRLIIQTIIHWG